MNKRIIRQIEELKDGQRYAIVFNERLTAGELGQLRTVCEGAHIQALILTNARVIPLAQFAGVIGEAADQVAELLAPAPNTQPRSTLGGVTVDMARFKELVGR